MPSARATASAVVRLSPVSMTTRMPSAMSALSASGVVALTGSAMATRPASFPSIATKIAVAPFARCASASRSWAAVGMLNSLRNFALPMTTRRLSTMPMAPLPVGELKPLTSARTILRSFAARTMAAASGCSLARSTLAASAKHFRLFESRQPGRWRRPRACPRSGAGLVDDQRITFSMRSNASAFLIKTPACAPRPTPTMIDIGVARPSAQGQAMISTVTAATRP